MPTPRDLSSEIGAIPGAASQLLAGNYSNLQQFGPSYTALTAANYRNALLGTPSFDSGAFLRDNPDLVANYNSDPGYKDFYGSLENYAKAHYDTWGANAPQYVTYTDNGAVGLARAAYQGANPELVAYNQTLGATLDRINGMPAPRYDAATAAAPTLGPAPQTSAATARLSRVGPSVLAPSLATDALNYSQVSPLQRELQRQAYDELTAGGPTSGELADAQQAARAAYSDRGLLRSNAGIGAEILATDALRRQRQDEARQFASTVDQQGFSQQQGNRTFALQAGEFLQSPDYFNATAANNASQFNAGQSNQVGLANTALRGQYGLTQYGTAADLNQFNAGQQNAAGQFNATLGYQSQADQFGRSLDYGNFLRSQAIDPSGLAANLSGSTPDYTAPLLNYGSDLYNTNFNAAAAQEIANANNKAATTGAIIGGVSKLGAATIATKVFFACIPEGQKIDTPHGGVCIENLRAGMRVLGYDGFPVFIVQKHEYMEDPAQKRFVCVEFEGSGHTLTVCDKHRVSGTPAGELQTGDVVGGRRIKSKTWHGGVRRSYDLLTADAGYRIAGVPVNSMIAEMAAAALADA